MYLHFCPLLFLLNVSIPFSPSRTFVILWHRPIPICGDDHFPKVRPGKYKHTHLQDGEGIGIGMLDGHCMKQVKVGGRCFYVRRGMNSLQYRAYIPNSTRNFVPRRLGVNVKRSKPAADHVQDRHEEVVGKGRCG